MTVSDDIYLSATAQALVPLLYEDAGYPTRTQPLETYGPFAEVVGELRALHQAADKAAQAGELFDVWTICRDCWEGMRTNDDGSKRYGLLDRAIHRIVDALDDTQDLATQTAIARDLEKPIGKTAAPATDYTAAPRMPIDVNDLLQMERKSTVWYAPSFLREGLGLLVGQPNVGKTPAAIQLAIAIATGQKWLNTVQCRHAKVLYLGMEYSPQELIPMFDISRMGQTIPRGWLFTKTIEDEFPTSPEAALADLEWYLRVMEVRVIVIDVLTAFLPPEKFKQNVYRGDYSELKPYHRLALQYNAAILGVWHASKRESDPKIMYNGSTGMWAAAASRVTMYQDQDQRVRITSFPRMGDRVDWALTQEKTSQGHRWVLADAAPEPMMNDTERAIWRWLKENSDKGNTRTPATIAEMTSIPHNTVKSTLRRMFEKNLLQQGTGSGYYVEEVATAATLATAATDTTSATVYDYTVATATALQPIDPASERAKVPRLQELHDSTDRTIADPFEALPPSLRMTTKMMMVSDLERNIETAQQRCEEYGLDYELLRAQLIEEARQRQQANGSTEPLSVTKGAKS